MCRVNKLIITRGTLEMSFVPLTFSRFQRIEVENSVFLGHEESGQKLTLAAANKMEDSKQRFGIKFGQDQQKDRVQLKVAAWALCKESNVASERGPNVMSSFSVEVPAMHNVLIVKYNDSVSDTEPFVMTQ